MPLERDSRENIGRPFLANLSRPRILAIRLQGHLGAILLRSELRGCRRVLRLAIPRVAGSLATRLRHRRPEVPLLLVCL